MSRIDIETEKLKQLAIDSENTQRKDDFYGKEDAVSHWNKKNDSAEQIMKEYGFESTVDLRERLLQMWDDEAAGEELATIFSVAVFKSKPDFQRKKSVQFVNQEQVEVPEYVYSF